MTRRGPRVLAEPPSLPALLRDAATLIETHCPRGSEPTRIAAELRRLAAACRATERAEDAFQQRRTPAPRP